MANTCTGVRVNVPNTAFDLAVIYNLSLGTSPVHIDLSVLRELGDGSRRNTPKAVHLTLPK
jgi:hypothetical protein